MLQRLVQALEDDEKDDAQSEVLRRFWSRPKTLTSRPAASPGPNAQVVDLARWTESRRTGR